MLTQGFVRKVVAVQVAVTFGMVAVFQTQSINNIMNDCHYCHKITCVDGTAGEKVECLAAAGRLNPVPGGASGGDRYARR